MDVLELRNSKLDDRASNNVWAGTVEIQIMDPYLFEGNLTADIYLEFKLNPAMGVITPNDIGKIIPASFKILCEELLEWEYSR